MRDELRRQYTDTHLEEILKVLIFRIF